MAKKKEKELSYLQMPLPQGKKYYRMTKRSWEGLNYRQTTDTGALSMESNISTLEAPYLVPSQKHIRIDGAQYANPIGLFGFDDFLVAIYRSGSVIWVDYIIYDAKKDEYRAYSSKLQENATEADEYPRCIVQFNKYVESEDIVNGEYTKRLLIFPDKKVMYFYEDDLVNDKDNTTGYDFALYKLDVTIKEYTNKEAPYLPPASADTDYYYKNTHSCEDTLYGEAIYKYCEYEVEGEDGNVKLEKGWKISVPPSFPDIKYATVHTSRLFGVSDDGVYASGFNDYSNWNLDSVAAGYNESNAWSSKAQSNTKADGNFTGITTFQGHVVCFKRDFMHEIYNTKNPFRIQDIYAEGALDNRTIQDVDGKLIFVSDDDVKVYTGSNPRIIGYPLNIAEYSNVCSGTDGRCYYLYCEDKGYHVDIGVEEDDEDEIFPGRLFVYDTYEGMWSEQSIADEIVSFAHNKNGMFYLSKDSGIYKMDTNDYDHTWSFETDLITKNTVDIKHIKKIQMLADIADGANLRAYILYDDEVFDDLTDEEKHERFLCGHNTAGKKAIRVKPRNTANFGVKLHIEGRGYVRLYELELFIENGGDLYA